MGRSISRLYSIIPLSPYPLLGLFRAVCVWGGKRMECRAALRSIAPLSLAITWPLWGDFAGAATEGALPLKAPHR